MRQRVKGLLLLLISVSILLAAFSSITFAQDEYLPPDDLDIEEITQMVGRVKFYAGQCTRYKCPKLDCNSASEIHRKLYLLRRETQLYAFWISKTPDYQRVERAKARYAKVTVLFRLLNALLRQGGARVDELLWQDDVRSPVVASFANCLLKLTPACGDLLKDPEREEFTAIFLMSNPEFAREKVDVFKYRHLLDYEQVKFTSSGEPSEGTANHPEAWRAGVENYLRKLRKDSLFLATFPILETDELWVELERRYFLPKEKIEVRYSTTSCCSETLKLTVVSGDRTISYLTLKPDRSKWHYERREPETAAIAAPETAGEYELRLFDPEKPNDFVYTQFEVQAPAPGPELFGRWRTDDGLEVLINRDGDRFVGNITALGKINELDYELDFKPGELIWRNVSLDSILDDGRGKYKAECFIPKKPDPFQNRIPPEWRQTVEEWFSFEFTMDSSDSILLDRSSCLVSPEQLKGFVRLWRVQRTPKTNTSENSKNRWPRRIFRHLARAWPPD